MKSQADTVGDMAVYSEGDTLNDPQQLVETLPHSLAEVEAETLGDTRGDA